MIDFRQVTALLIVIISLTIVNAAKTEKTANKTKTENKPQKPQFGIPFAFKHTNSGTFFDENFNADNSTTTKKPATNKKKQRSRRFSEIEALNSNAKRYSFSFKSLADLDLPLSEHGEAENQEAAHNHQLEEEYAAEKDKLDFLGRTIPDVSKPGKSRLTESLISSLNKERLSPEQKNSNISRVAP